MSLVIVDYGVGNLGSIQNMLKKAGAQSSISGDPQVIAQADKLILAGVGAFDHCMESLGNAGLIELLSKKVLQDKVPVLGICAGMQMLMQESEEGKLGGLGWISGKVVKFRTEQMHAAAKVPHMGWTDVTPNKQGKLLAGLNEEPRFYFAHSYHASLDAEDVLLYADYGYRFAAAVEKGNILGVQFHPEKSHRYGMQLLSNFAGQY